MRTETSTGCASRRGRLRLSLCTIYVLCAFPCDSGAANALEPKRPESKTTNVRVTHTHRAVRECQYEASKPERRCVTKLASGDARTTLQLVPVRNASLEARHDDRKPINVALDSLGESSGLVVVAAGRWKIVWWPHAGQDQFDAAPPEGVSVSLETLTGACELEGNACKLVPSAVKRSVRVMSQ
jgi:hypothetical protein